MAALEKTTSNRSAGAQAAMSPGANSSPSPAKAALYASIGGLVVNGKSLDGVPFDPEFAAELEPGKPLNARDLAKLRAMGIPLE